MRAANLRPSRLAPLVLLAATACNQWDDRNRALEVAREVLGCFDVALEQTESHRFHAEGCGGTADVACSEGSLNPVCIRVAERGTSGGEAEREVIDEEPTEPVEAEAPSAAEETIRRGLDARADDVLACVDRASVPVRVTHAEDGHVTIALSGDLHDTPEEGCVRAALGDVRAPPGEAGVVLHLVRARRARPPEPAPTEPVPTEPVPTEPAPTEPGPTEPSAPPAPSVMEGAVVEQLD